MAEPPPSGAKLIRTLQGAPDVRLTACCLLPKRQQIATGSQDGTLLLWNLAPGRPRPVKLGAQGGQVTCIRAVGQTLVSSSTAKARGSQPVLVEWCKHDSTVSIWKSHWEKSKAQKPATLKLHFSPVRCCDLSLDERLLLTASDDKTLKLSSVPERRFLTSYLGHSNWVRAASLSASAQNIVSGGDDKTVRLWDVERKSSVQTFYDSASSITCTKFGMDDSILVASAWDSSINIWDVRSFQLRQHYGRAHGTSPITQVAVHPRGDLVVSAGADRQLRLWDLRAGKLRNSILGHDRPIHSCSWDESGNSVPNSLDPNLITHDVFCDQFLSCDSDLVFYWSLPPPDLEPVESPSMEESGAVEDPAADEAVETKAPPLPATPPSEDPEPSAQPASLENLLEAAWAGEKVLQNKVADLQEQDLSEAAALMLEKMVSDMDVVTGLLQSIEQRMASNEAATAELQQLLQRSVGSLGG